MDWFDLMSSEHFHVILHPDKIHGLIFNRLDDTVATINHDDARELSNLKRVGRIYGIVGRYLGKYLVLIKNRSLVGLLYDPNTKCEHEIYTITQVQVIDVSCVSGTQDTSNGNSVRYDASFLDNEIQLGAQLDKESVAEENQDFSSLPITINTSSFKNARVGPWNPFKLANSFRPRLTAQFLKPNPIIDSSSSDNGGSGPSQAESGGNQNDDSHKRLVEEMIKLFNNTNSFYFSPTLDLTNRFSRIAPSIKKSIVGNEALWKSANKQFFWNRHMLKDLIELSERDDDANYFIRVILQGFIAIEQQQTNSNNSLYESIETGIMATSTIDMGSTSVNDLDSNTNNCDKADGVGGKLSDGKENCNLNSTRSYQLALVSRRSVFHAGTRYRRRGCDEDGNCANFVETEQIFRYNKHFTSVVMLRGSIPLFWYQTGYNYRPPPVLYRSEEENHEAFTKHFKNLINSYETDRIISIDCTEQTGREKSLHDAFKSHMDKLRVDEPNLELIQFDFHRLCRGRQSTDSQVEKSLRSCGLTEQVIKDARYYWNDGELVWSQGGVFRVNCLDCSDRTNVVQRAIALQILDSQLSRLGVIAPDTCPENNRFRRTMQIMWSTNGNVLSTQYCGTRALFTGDKKISGYLKDTYSSASRYYISKFRDAYRQAAIDAMLGVESNSREPSTMGQEIGKLPGIDQYEMLSLDPIISGRSGSALLRDVGSRVTDRLSRLKGRFYVKPSELINMQYSRDDTAVAAISSETGVSDIIDAKAIDELSGLNIDWPSTESMEHNINSNKNSNKTKNNDNSKPLPQNNIFAQLSTSDDSFQDDEFGQLMLSIDLSDLQRVHDIKSKESGSKAVSSADKREVREEIIMTEARGLKGTSNEPEVSSQPTTSTTST